MLLIFKALTCFWPRSSDSSFCSLHFRIHDVSKLPGGKSGDIVSYKILSFFSWKLQKRFLLSTREIFWYLWKWIKRPKEDWQRTTWLKNICVEGFGAILSVFPNHNAHLGFFPNSILITCSQIAVCFFFFFKQHVPLPSRNQQFQIL